MLVFPLLFGGAFFLTDGGGSGGAATIPVSAEVEAYGPQIRQYAKEEGILDYVELIQAVMMQESGGCGEDPMQASECAYNTRYPRRPGGDSEPGRLFCSRGRAKPPRSDAHPTGPTGL